MEQDISFAPDSPESMRVYDLIDASVSPQGVSVELQTNGTDYFIFSGGSLLMSSSYHATEEALASLAWEASKKQENPRVLIGGLGMGYTLRAALDLLPADAMVVVVELMPQVAVWNRGIFSSLNGGALDDNRVILRLEDCVEFVVRTDETFDLILMDLDNTLDARAQPGNGGLYEPSGLASLKRCLSSGGILAFWFQSGQPLLEKRLNEAGMESCCHELGSGQGEERHSIILARRKS